MSLSIQDIRFSGFRNYASFCLSPTKNIVILVGDNAIGKTNIIEGIQLLTMMESFRNPQWKETVLWGKDKGELSLHLIGDGREVDISLYLQEGKRSYNFNGKKKKINEIRGTIPSVLFTPDDLNLIKGSSRGRRNELDFLGIQLSPTYGTIRDDYEKVVRQRNSLLKIEEFNGTQFHAWNCSLTSLGTLLFLHRIHLFEKFKPYIEESFKEIAPHEEINIEYIPSWEKYLKEEERFSYNEDRSKEELEEFFLMMLERVKKEEISRGLTVIGPHKDEIQFFLNGRNAHIYGSQGQQRSIVLALKIAEIKFIAALSGKNPVLLLDDVMSELDEKRREALFSSIPGEFQTFITTTNIGYFSHEILDKAEVFMLPLTKEETL